LTAPRFALKKGAGKAASFASMFSRHSLHGKRCCMHKTTSRTWRTRFSVGRAIATYANPWSMAHVTLPHFSGLMPRATTPTIFFGCLALFFWLLFGSFWPFSTPFDSFDFKDWVSEILNFKIFKFLNF
jgi:hypothetical protein